MAENFQLRVTNGGTLAPTEKAGTANSEAKVALHGRADVGGASSLTTPFFESLTPNLTHVGDGFYEPANTPSPGELLLVVTAPGASPVVQRVTLTDVGGFLRVAAGWSDPSHPDQNGQVAAVDLVNFKASKANKKPPLRSQVTVKLFPRRELVFLSGTEFHGQDTDTKRTVWRLFAEGRRNLLRAASGIGDGDLVTMLVCEQRVRRTLVKAATGGPTKWVVIDEFVKSGAQRTNPFPTKDEPAQPGVDLDILDLYAYLHRIGTDFAKSVAEISIFSHSFFRGPILWDTFESDGTPNFRDDPVNRDPNDLDGRAKDWVAGGAVATSFGHLADCLASDGFMKVWGCNAEFFIGQFIRQAEGKLAPAFPHDTMFGVTVVDTHVTDPRISRTTDERCTQAHLLQAIAFRVRSAYAGGAASTLGRRVFGAPTGVGSSMGARGGNSVLFINQPEHRAVYELYDRELGATPMTDADGYVDFQALVAKLGSLPTPIWSTERSQIVTDRNKAPTPDTTFVRVAAGSGAARRLADGAFRREGQHGLVDPAKNGHLLIAPFGSFVKIAASPEFDGSLALIGKDTGRDCALYMQEDGVVFLMTRARGATAWAKESRTIPGLGGIASVSDGVLQSVTPGFIW